MKRLSVVMAMVLAACWQPPTEMPQTDGGSATGGGSAQQQQPTLELSPATLTIPLGASASVRAFMVQPDGTSNDVTATADFRVEPEGVVTVSAGQLRGVAAGLAMVVAKSNGIEARASVTVPAAQVMSVDVTVAETSVVVGTLIDASALATLSDGSKVDVTQTALWSVGPVGVPVLDLLSPGRAIAKLPGEGHLKATVGALTGIATLTVRDVALASLVVTPGSATVPVAGTLQLFARGRFVDGTETDLSRMVTWTSSTPAFTVDATGKATAVSAGTASIRASLNGIDNSATLTASQATLQQLTVMPGSLSLAIRGTGQLRVVATYSDGSTADVTSSASFTSSAPNTASVSTAGTTRGLVSALAAGQATITARLANVSATAPIVVTAAALQSLELTPRNVTLPSNGVVAVRARGLYADGSQADVTEQALWSSADTTIATVSNVASARGQIRGALGGTTVITATVDGIRATVDVTVQAPTLMMLEVAPGRISVEAGRMTSLRAVAWFSDNSTRDVTQLATWTSLQPTIVSTTATRGQVRAAMAGTATIQAVFQGQTANGVVLVQQATITQLSISPGAITMPVGLPMGFEAIAAYSDGTAYPVTTQVQWTSSDAAIADVIVAQGYAYLDSKMPGVVTITATMEGAPTAQARITLTTASLSRIDVTPAQPSLPVGAYVELYATGVYSDLTTQFLRYAASWTSSDPSVASVGNGQQDKGLVWGLRAGTTTITATYNGVSSSTVLTVTQASLSRIEVTPFAPRLPVGFDTYVRATGIYSDNTTRDLTYIVSWTTSAPNIASLGTSAYLQPLQPGTATLTATYNGTQGTTVVTVTNATLMGITLGSPNSMPLAVQETRKLTAMGSFSDGSMMDVTPYVTWLSSAAPVASVSNAWPANGEVKGLSAGSATITAIRSGVSATAPIVVR